MSEFNDWTQMFNAHMGNTEYGWIEFAIEILVEQEPDYPIEALADALKDLVDPEAPIAMYKDRDGADVVLYHSPLVQNLLQGALEEMDWQGLAECWEDSFKYLGGVKGDDGTWSWE